VRILGVSCDTPADNKAWKEKQGYGYDLLTDAEKTLDNMVLGEAGGRWAVLVDADGKIEKVWPKVQPAFPKKVVDEI
jgi:peroxiredoxin